MSNEELIRMGKGAINEANDALSKGHMVNARDLLSTLTRVIERLEAQSAPRPLNEYVAGPLGEAMRAQSAPLVADSREALVNALGQYVADAYDTDWVVTVEEYVADALLAAGWRKKPSREAVERTLSGQGIFHPNSKAFKSLADAILALLEGPTETGEK